ncbi:caspase family protein [Streptomyces sp. NBC_00140]|uniref:VMAP-C domain-containing protein n=1 Tax=Streptomyces sp. NBC_00140 TaxID=2975664 RepID=UPI0022566C77|nr:caspase family protein [Streptomyces sp. NBC_00140]MCX5336789.1 caspase family protein [Streptomyces sp. NBC_00140]
MIPALRPEKVFALIVGIESYQAGRGWSLPGPARDALRFAEWLTDTAGVPPAHVHLLLSPLAQSHAETSTPATWENIHRTLFKELPNCDGDLLWIYWAGHGYLDPKHQLLLPTADATVGLTSHLNLQAALRWWQSSNIPSGNFRRVVAIGDTCRIEDRRARSLKFGTNDPEAGDHTPERRQFVLYAALPGEAAKNDAERQAGQFTDTLLKHLAGKAVDTSIDGLVDIARAVQADFAILRAQGEAWQTPQFVISNGWDGSSLFGNHWTDTDTATGTNFELGGAPVLDQRAWTDLGQLLTAPSLPAYSYDAYRWAFEVSDCAVPPDDALPAAHLLDIVRDLDSRQGRHGFPLALPFIRHLAARASGNSAGSWAAEAHAWVDRTCERLGSAPVPFPPGPEPEGPALHIQLEPDGDNTYWTRMWLYQREFESVWESSQPLEMDAVRAALGQQLFARGSRTPGRIEFHVPQGLLDERFESWQIPWRGNRMQELGCVFEVVLCCPDDRRGLATAPWYRKWAWLKAQGGRHPLAVRDVHDGDVSALLGASLQETEPPVVVLAEVTEPMIWDTLDAVLDGGVPIAIWWRTAAVREGTAEPIRTALAVDAAPFDVQTLPALLRRARINKQPLALMWDDPGRIPERQTLIS